MDIQEIYDQYIEQELLPIDWKKQLYMKLKSFLPSDLNTIDEHRKYIEALQKLRLSNAEDMELNGKKFLDTIVSLLAVGEDGVYSNNLRFIYELIQNVDDCDYSNPSDCHLDIQFVYDPAPGKIILTYNEEGFKPVNVFGITGIAEESKNISADKVEIGEKGIGFKSVFGVAEKVLIESGLFSFELHKNNFTVPIPKYDGFKPIAGTRLTIFLDSKHKAKDIHMNLLEQYTKKDAVLNKNPILFLNKLTHIKMYFDNWRYIEFEVERNAKSQSNELYFEDDVIVSVDMKNHVNGMDKENKNIVSCRRYTQSIVYGKQACIDRYGEDVAFEERHHNLIAIFPILDEKFSNFEGVMYSFLPTQIKIAAPLVLHVPYKLDGSREFVDPHGNDEWFKYTNKQLETFLKKIYIHMAGEVHQKIVEYLPRKFSYLFKRDNQKVDCLCVTGLKADVLYEQPIFYCENGKFESNKGIVSFDKDDKYENAQRIYELLNLQKKLFIPSNDGIDMKWFGGEVINNVSSKLFMEGLNNAKIFAEVIDILKNFEDVHYYQMILGLKEIVLTPEQIGVIASYKKLADSFNSLLSTRIASNERPGVVFKGTDAVDNNEIKSIIRELVDSADLEPVFEHYLKAIDFNIIPLDIAKKEFAIAGRNAIIVSAKAPLGSFGELSSNFDPRKTFSATLQIRQASDKLNAADENMSNQDYLKLLRGVRHSLVGAFGKKAYSSYISIINNAGADKNRFLNELLQNADDCTYPVSVKPKFELSISGDILSVAYNENGFLKDNVRAITAIGESTKKMLLNGEDRAIGEKGIGFKSVFGVADYVDIHSNRFDFRLTSEMPTVPEKIEAIKAPGTLMKYKLKDSGIKKVFTDEKILNTCLCLRNLKDITILGIRITINDSGNKRIITINGKTYEFERIIYDFVIDDEDALAERSLNQKQISENQYIACYIPPKEYKCEKYYLYSGLPVSQVESYIPLIIDAPFELTTARDDVLESNWNYYVRDAIYEAVISVMEQKKQEQKLDVLRYVHYQNQNGTVTFQLFTKRYLNGFDWINQLKRMNLLPVYGSQDFVKPGSDKRIIPDIVSSAIGKISLDDIDEIIIDTRKKSQYIPLLELLGCEKYDSSEELDFFEEHLGFYLDEKKIRDTFYDYLVSRHQEYELKHLGIRIRALKIYPIRFEGGTEYREYTSNIYTHNSKKSNDSFLVLDTNIMPYEICQGILGLGCRINELTQDVYDAQYRKTIEAYITSNRSEEDIAQFLLREFNYNFDEFKKCKISLVGLLSEIPMEMANGEYCTGNKYINSNDLILDGTIIKMMYVSKKYEHLAEFLGCTDVLLIHYSDIDASYDIVSDTDIEDILGDFKYYIDILSGMMEDGHLTDEQIEKYNLQFLGNSIDDDYDDDYDEEFPGRRVKDLKRLQQHIKEQFLYSPNPYVRKQRIVREPRSKVNKEAYTTSMYQSEYSDKKCFCQMCKQLVKKSHIERNDVQKKPKYGWNQMYLSLCLNCSKDFILLRNNPAVWRDFIEEICVAEVEGVDTVDISIGEQEISFTATHLAEIQEIMKLEMEDDREFDDELIDATDEYEEEDEEIFSLSPSIVSSADSKILQKDKNELIMPDGAEFTSIERIVAANPGKKVIVVKETWTNDYCLCVEEFTGTIKAEGTYFRDGKRRSEGWEDRRHRKYRIYEGPSKEKILEYYKNKQ